MSFSNKFPLFGVGAFFASILIVACGPSSESPYKKDLNNKRANTSGNPAVGAVGGGSSVSISGYTFQLGKLKPEAQKSNSDSSEPEKATSNSADNIAQEPPEPCQLDTNEICVLENSQATAYKNQLLEELDRSLHFSSFTLSTSLEGTDIISSDSLEKALLESLIRFETLLKNKSKKHSGVFDHGALILSLKLPDSLDQDALVEHQQTFSNWLREKSYGIQVKQNKTGPEELLELKLIADEAQSGDLSNQVQSSHELPQGTKAELVLELACHHR
jgi:hypothetical protein